jgi:hypothetical protein
MAWLAKDKANSATISESIKDRSTTFNKSKGSSAFPTMKRKVKKGDGDDD